MSVQQVHQNVRPTLAAVPQSPTERHHGGFSQVTTLPLSFSIKPNDTISLYRARMDNRNVILRVLKGTVGCLLCLLKKRREMFCFALFSATRRSNKYSDNCFRDTGVLDLNLKNTKWKVFRDFRSYKTRKDWWRRSLTFATCQIKNLTLNLLK